jgi:hypothetical protein
VSIKRIKVGGSWVVLEQKDLDFHNPKNIMAEFFPCFIIIFLNSFRRFAIFETPAKAVAYRVGVQIRSFVKWSGITPDP